MNWYKRLQDIWLWTVAVVFTIAGFCVLCALICLIVIGVQKLFTE